jgi:hypothetical protein
MCGLWKNIKLVGFISVTVTNGEEGCKIFRLVFTGQNTSRRSPRVEVYST